MDVVVEDEKKEKPSEIDRAIVGTRAILEQWKKDAPNGDVNVGPQALHQRLAQANREAIKDAFSPRAAAPLLTDILLGACRIEAWEKLRDRTDRVKKTLPGLLGSLRKQDSSLDFPVVLLDERGRAAWSRLSSLAAKDVNLAYRTVVLPVAAGGLDVNGMLDSKATDRRRERWRHRISPHRASTTARARQPPTTRRSRKSSAVSAGFSRDTVGGVWLGWSLSCAARTSPLRKKR